MILNKLLRFLFVITCSLYFFIHNYYQDHNGFMLGQLDLQGFILSGFFVGVLPGVVVVALITFFVIKFKSKNVPKPQTPSNQPNVICEKHPGHANFIGSSVFEMKDLPDGFRGQDLLDFIRTFSGLVVRIVVYTKSEHRTSLEAGKDVFENGECVYGSGLLWNAQVSQWRVNTRCPCVGCRGSAHPVMQWGEIPVYTAHHVIWDDIEAASATVDLYLDGTGKEIQLKGLKVIRADPEGDLCEMSVVIHEKEVYDEIISKIEKCYETAREASEDEKLTILQGGDYLVIIISHPHGMDKKISVGRSKRRNADNSSKTGIFPVSYTYDTPTCPGSSGAPVLLVGLEKITISFPPHCGSKKRNRNFSGKGIELDRAKEKGSPVSFICSNKEFAKGQKVIKLWRLLRVYLRKLSTFSTSFVRQLPKKKLRKPTKKFIEKLTKFRIRTTLKNNENAQFSPPLVKDANDSSLIYNNKTEHSHFLQKRNLTINSLPEQFQDEVILNQILQLCDLTGLIVLPNDQFTCFIIYLDFDRYPKMAKCPCTACRQSKKPKKEWMSFVARTSSKCAQYQNSGLLLAKCMFYYDDQNHMDKYLYVHGVIKKDNERKSLDVLLVTHDMETARRIQKTLEEYRRSATKLSKKFQNCENNLTVIPCHPDGLPKCVCIGQYPSKNTAESKNTADSDNTTESKNTADSDDTADSTLWHPFEAAACRGSAGAPVCPLNGQRLVYVGINQAINISNSGQFKS